MSTVDELVGRNLHRLREERSLTQDDVAGFLRSMWGVPWTRGMVANAELGRRTLDLGELGALCLTLGCSVFDLLAGDNEVVMGDGPLGSSRVLQLCLQGGSQVLPDDIVRQAREQQRIESREQAARGGAEIAAARRLGVEPIAVARASFRLWGRSFTAERDARERHPLASEVATSTRRARRGHITRQLTAELREQLSKGSRRK